MPDPPAPMVLPANASSASTVVPLSLTEPEPPMVWSAIERSSACEGTVKSNSRRFDPVPRAYVAVIAPVTDPVTTSVTVPVTSTCSL